MFGAVEAPAPRALRREVLRWLQSLDLSHSVRNIRRCVLTRTAQAGGEARRVAFQRSSMAGQTARPEQARRRPEGRVGARRGRGADGASARRDAANGFLVAEICSRYYPVSGRMA